MIIKKAKKGFTIIEIIVVLAILGILLGMTAPSVSKQISADKERDREVHEVMINKAIRQYYALEGKYPVEISKLKEKKFGPNIDNEKYIYEHQEGEEIKEVRVKLK